MKINSKIFYLFVAISLLILSFGIAQRVKSRILLAKDRSRLEQKIILTNKLLADAETQSEKSLGELSVIKGQIFLREQLIETLEEEILEAQSQVDTLTDDICKIEESVDKIKQSYAVTAQLTYRSFNEDNLWLAILSSQGLSEAYYRMIYFQQFSRYRKNQIASMLRSQSELLETTQALENSISQNESFIEEKKREVENLANSKNIQTELVEKLRDREEEYRKTLNSQRVELTEILEKMDIDATEAIASAKNPLLNTSNPTLDAKTKSFEQRKGRLPWPVPQEKSFIIGKFGKTQDNYGNEVQNDGIFIRTAQGQEVQCVADGQVTGVMKMPGSGTVVVLSHGKYRTVYANLRESRVQKGDVVKVKDLIGVVYTDSRSNESILHFIIHQAPKQYLNPVSWLERD
jgi:septal ring factor EnvC (AmiA/AmiB activator)